MKKLIGLGSIITIFTLGTFFTAFYLMSEKPDVNPPADVLTITLIVIGIITILAVAVGVIAVTTARAIAYPVLAAFASILIVISVDTKFVFLGVALALGAGIASAVAACEYATVNNLPKGRVFLVLGGEFMVILVPTLLTWLLIS